MSHAAQGLSLAAAGRGDRDPGRFIQAGYLATTPGGIDAILIIGATVPVDLPFILSAQVVRVLLVLLAGPALVAPVARRLG